MVRMGSNGDSRGSLAGRGDNGNTDGTLESPEMGIIPEFQDGQAGRDHAGHSLLQHRIVSRHLWNVLREETPPLLLSRRNS